MLKAYTTATGKSHTTKNQLTPTLHYLAITQKNPVAFLNIFKSVFYEIFFQYLPQRRGGQVAGHFAIFAN